MVHKSHPLISTILDSVNDGVFTVDEEMTITSFNRAAEEITGYTKDEAIGKKCYEIFRTDVCANACPVKESLETGHPVSDRQVYILNKQNKKVPISISASILKDADGKPIGGVETMRDQSLIYALRREIEEKYTFMDLASRSPVMRKLFNVLPDIACSEATVLINGDSGTGKELIAKAIHDLSHRKNGPMVVVNCGALPEPLLEAEIFGAKRGAYTGAIENRPGRLEMAQGGTLFLDEIGDLPLPLQVKLLRVLENHEFQPLGAKAPEKADVRFLAATHRDLDAMVEEGAFRRDLYFRINVISLKIPPLCERPEDIPLLVDIFLQRFNQTYKKNIKGFTPEAFQVLLDHDYPGNVRELLNLVEQTVILCRDREIGLDAFPESFIATKKTSSVVKLKSNRGGPSKEMIQETLDKYGGNKTKVAQALGVDRTTLWRWMKRANLC